MISNIFQYSWLFGWFILHFTVMWYVYFYFSDWLIDSIDQNSQSTFPPYSILTENNYCTLFRKKLVQYKSTWKDNTNNPIPVSKCSFFFFFLHNFFYSPCVSDWFISFILYHLTRCTRTILHSCTFLYKVLVRFFCFLIFFSFPRYMVGIIIKSKLPFAQHSVKSIENV